MTKLPLNQDRMRNYNQGCIGGGTGGHSVPPLFFQRARRSPTFYREEGVLSLHPKGSLHLIVVLEF